eukprot:349954-Chlamydomonas_euryale.AAC.3
MSSRARRLARERTFKACSVGVAVTAVLMSISERIARKVHWRGGGKFTQKGNTTEAVNADLLPSASSVGIERLRSRAAPPPEPATTGPLKHEGPRQVPAWSGALAFRAQALRREPQPKGRFTPGAALPTGSASPRRACVCRQDARAGGRYGARSACGGAVSPRWRQLCGASAAGGRLRRAAAVVPSAPARASARGTSAAPLAAGGQRVDDGEPRGARCALDAAAAPSAGLWRSAGRGPG